MAYRVQKYANREEWLAEREKGIGSSEVGTILGINHFDTPLRLWRRKQKLDPKTEENDAMKRGHRMEIVVANDFAEATGAIIDNSSVDDWHAVDVDRPFLRVSPDRLFWPKGTPAEEQTLETALILECKTCREKVTAETVFEVFPYWYAQIQYQMGVMGVKKCALGWICVADSNLPFGYTWVDFNEKYYTKVMVPRLEKFWNENILGGVEPEEVIDLDDVSIRYSRASDGKSVAAGEELVKEVVRYTEVSSLLKELKKEQETLQFDIKAAMGEADSLTTPDGSQVIATWNNVSGSSKFNVDAFREAYPAEYEKYRRLFDEDAFKNEEPDVYKGFLVPGNGTRRLVVKGVKEKKKLGGKA